MWIKVNNISDMPMDGKEFISFWKGRVCITQYDEEEKCFFLSFSPADYEKNMRVPDHLERRFYYWMPLPSTPEGY